MAMRTYGVETKGMTLTETDFQNLLLLNKDNIEQKFGEQTFDFKNIDEVLDFTYNIDFATIIYEFNGYLDISETQDRVYFGGKYDTEDIILFELKKYDLYDKYENKEEVIKELKKTLSEVGIIVDDNYIEKHFGYINGSYVA